jgi:hypothetical protein
MIVISTTRIRKEPHLGKSEWLATTVAMLRRREFFPYVAVPRLLDSYRNAAGFVVELRGGHRVGIILPGKSRRYEYVLHRVEKIEQVLDNHVVEATVKS